MGVTVSHTTLAPISLASTIIGFISFAFTLATFFNVFWSNLQTIHSAPSEINDFLSNLKQGLLDERRHLRKVRKRMRSARRDIRGRSRSDHGGGGGGSERRMSRGQSRGRVKGDGKGGSKYAPTHFTRDEQAFRSQGEGEALRVMRIAIRDMIRSFYPIERPFLKPEFQNDDSAHWSTNTPQGKYPNFNPYNDDEDDFGLGKSSRFGNEYMKCGFKERYLWLRKKQDVVSMMESLSRIEVRRMAHEVGEVLMSVGDIGRDLEDVRDSMLALEGRMSRVVGVRRVDYHSSGRSSGDEARQGGRI